MLTACWALVILGIWCFGLRLSESCSVRYKIQACSCLRVSELRSAVEMLASVSAVRLSCWSALEGVISIATTVSGIGAVCFGGWSSSSSVFMGSVLDGDGCAFLVRSEWSKRKVVVRLGDEEVQWRMSLKVENFAGRFQSLWSEGLGISFR